MLIIILFISKDKKQSSVKTSNRSVETDFKNKQYPNKPPNSPASKTSSPPNTPKGKYIWKIAQLFFIYSFLI